MGMPQDRRQRDILARDDDRRRIIVGTARELIYDKNFAVGSAAVERMLKPHSWVPTSVRLNHFCKRP